MANLFQEENGALRVCAIHLAQAEERKRRFLEMNQIEGVHFVFVDGVDGRQLDLEELLRQNLMRPGTSRFTFSTLGSGLAHRATWLQAAASELPTLVCEDDAAFRKDFRRQFEACTKAIPGDWDLILLGYNFDSVLDAESSLVLSASGLAFSSARLVKPSCADSRRRRTRSPCCPYETPLACPHTPSRPREPGTCSRPFFRSTTGPCRFPRSPEPSSPFRSMPL